MEEFYVYLPSNASSDVYPNNTATHFKVNLAQPLHLEGNWRTAMVELSYSNSVNTINGEAIELYEASEPVKIEEWRPESHGRYMRIIMMIGNSSKVKHNAFILKIELSSIDRDYEYAYLTMWSDNKEVEQKFKPLIDRKIKDTTGVRFTMSIDTPFGTTIPKYNFNLFIKPPPKLVKQVALLRNRYDTVEEMCLSLNRQMNIELFHAVPDRPNRLSVRNLKSGAHMILKHDLKYILGFKHDKIIHNQIAEFEAELDLSFALYIYSNIVRESRVGDSFVPLLRTLPIQHTRYGQTVNCTMQNPYFIDVAGNDFSNIEISIMNKAGKPYPLTPQSEVLITLKFIKVV